MKTAGKVFLILFWAVIWAVTTLPYLIVAALFYVFDLVFWKLEGILQHCIDEVKRLGGECGWLEGEDEEPTLAEVINLQKITEDVELALNKVEDVKARARHRATIEMLKAGRGKVDIEDNEDGN